VASLRGRPAALLLLSLGSAAAYTAINAHTAPWHTAADARSTLARPRVARNMQPKAGLVQAAVLTTKVAPALGAGLANTMFFSGLPEVLEKRKLGELGDFNPLPLPIIFGNTLGWLSYSLLTGDPFVAAANAPGLLLSGWYIMTAVQLATPEMVTRIEKLSLLMGAIHVCAGLTAAFLLPTRSAMVALYGIVCNGILLAYYGAPLTTIGTVLRERSAASIYLPTVLVNGANAIFWSTYALAIRDRYLLVPNAIGAMLAIVQTALCMAFRAKEATAGDT